LSFEKQKFPDRKKIISNLRLFQNIDEGAVISTAMMGFSTSTKRSKGNVMT